MSLTTGKSIYQVDEKDQSPLIYTPHCQMIIFIAFWVLKENKVKMRKRQKAKYQQNPFYLRRYNAKSISKGRSRVLD